MSNRIVYQISGLPVSVVIPCSEEIDIVQIGEKAVPAGVPFWVVDESTIPPDRTFRDAWDLDVTALGEASGFGGAPQENEQ